MACDSRYSTAQMFADFWCLDEVCPEERTTIEHFLDIASSDIHAALASVGACDCTLASWATGYLQKLEIIDAAAYFNCKCMNPRFSTEYKTQLMQWAANQFEMLMTGKIDVCDSATGSGFPAIGIAQQGLSEFQQAQIILNDILRNSG